VILLTEQVSSDAVDEAREAVALCPSGALSLPDDQA
jgi:ferredoxin